MSGFLVVLLGGTVSAAPPPVLAVDSAFGASPLANDAFG